MEFRTFEPPEPLGFTHRLRDSVPSQVGDPCYEPNSPFKLPGGVEIRLDKLVKPDLPPRLKVLRTVPQAARLNPCILIAQRCSRITPQFEAPGKSAYTPGLPISDFACPLCTHTHYFVEPPREAEPALDKALESSSLQSTTGEDNSLEDGSLGNDSPEGGSEEEGSVGSSTANEEVEAPIERCNACDSVTMKLVFCYSGCAIPVPQGRILQEAERCNRCMLTVDSIKTCPRGCSFHARNPAKVQQEVSVPARKKLVPGILRKVPGPASCRSEAMPMNWPNIQSLAELLRVKPMEQEQTSGGRS